PSQLPDPPPVTPGNTPCGSAPIDLAPTFPVLADGLFEHSQPFSEPQTIEITLPDDLSCTNCTLQVIQFMSNHALNNPGGCYYHHCATIAVEADPTATSSATEDTGPPGNDETTSTPGDDTTGDGGPATTDPGPGTSNNGTDDATVGVPGTDSGLVPGNSDSGCGCSLPTHGRGRSLPIGLGLLGLLGLVIRRRR
ncbi:MAG: hypothetical protein K0V04_25590, partial [Deltaproteobacteria bacterium]|nr:hypothetical protein [Deltaproteobacteria bacterium]